MKTSEVARLTGVHHQSLLHLANGAKGKLYGVTTDSLFNTKDKEPLHKNCVGRWVWPEWVVDKIKEGKADV